MGAPFCVFIIIGILEPVIPCHHAEELQCLLNMLQLLGIRYVVSVFTLLHKVIRYHPKIAFEYVHLFPAQIRDFKDVNFVIVYKGTEFFRYVRPFPQYPFLPFFTFLNTSLFVLVK